MSTLYSTSVRTRRGLAVVRMSESDIYKEGGNSESLRERARNNSRSRCCRSLGKNTSCCLQRNWWRRASGERLDNVRGRGGAAVPVAVAEAVATAKADKMAAAAEGTGNSAAAAEADANVETKPVALLLRLLLPRRTWHLLVKVETGGANVDI